MIIIFFKKYKCYSKLQGIGISFTYTTIMLCGFEYETSGLQVKVFWPNLKKKKSILVHFYIYLFIIWNIKKDSKFEILCPIYKRFIKEQLYKYKNYKRFIFKKRRSKINEYCWNEAWPNGVKHSTKMSCLNSHPSPPK